MAENNTPKVAESTTIDRNDANVNLAEIMRPMKIDASLSRSADSGFRDTVISFLKKPVVIRRGQWNASSPLPPDPIHAIAVPEELLANTVYKNKIDGYFAFRATAVIRLQVNANKFQQGRLIMSYIPQGQVNGMFPNLRLFSLRTITQLPNVQLDAACDTEAILKVPYVSPTTHYNLLDQTGPHGVVYLHNYSALQYGTGVSYADYTIWGSFEDIELITPTLPASSFSTAPSFARSASRKRVPVEGRDYSSYNMVTSEKVVVVDLTGVDPGVIEREKDTTFVSQAKKVKFASVRPSSDTTDKELANVNAGPVESVFNGINTISTALEGVPLLSSVAAPVSWVSAALAKTAGHFGWSNPANEGVRNKLTIFPYVNNSNAIDQSFPMGLKVDNKIQVLPGFAGTDIDEMNLAYVCGVSAWWTTMNWTTSTGSGDLLGSWPMNLDSFRQLSNITTGDSVWTVADYCPSAFVSELFEFWRGSIRLTFKFPKTDFHSGRLVVAFTPGYSDVLAPTLDDTDYLHREIIDIREGNEFTLTFPYASTLSWLDRSESYGKVWLFVLNPLVAPDTVAQNIQIITEMSVAPDVQFQNPTSCPHRVWGSEETVAPFVSQSGETKLEKPCDIVDETIGNSKIMSDFYAATKYCAGEEVSTFLHLLKRVGRLDISTKYTTVKNMSLRPFTIGGTGDPEGTPDDSQRSVFCGDLYSILAPLYAYSRGSMRLNFMRKPGGFTDQRVFYYPSSTQDPIVNAESSSIFPLLYRNGSSVPFDTTKDGGGSVQCPHYNQLHSRLNRITYDNDVIAGSYVEPVDIYSSRNRVAYECTDAAGASSTTPAVYRSVGDDFALGFFLGVPPMVLAIAPRP